MRVFSLVPWFAVACGSTSPEGSTLPGTGSTIPGTGVAYDLSTALAYEACSSVTVLAEAPPLRLVVEVAMEGLFDALVAGTPLEASGTIGTTGFEALANDGDFFDSPCDTVEWGFTGGPQWRGIAGTVAATYTPYAPVSATDYDWAYGQPLGDVVVRIDELVMEPLTEDLDALTAQELSLEAAHATLWVPAR